MKSAVIIANISGWIKKNKNPAGLVIFVPGILTDIESSSFLTILDSRSSFDIFLYNVYTKATDHNLAKGIDDFVSDLSDVIAESKKSYKNIFIISYSSGSEIVLRTKLDENVRALALWSPSFFYPQSITNTLASCPKNEDLLIFQEKLISRKVARALDSFNTAQLAPSIRLPIHIYSSQEDKRARSWSNPEMFNTIHSEKKHTNVPYNHAYTEKQIIELYKDTQKWFMNFI